jgi:glycosyltransferase 2 family protein
MAMLAVLQGHLKLPLKVIVTGGAIWLVFRNYDLSQILTLLKRADAGWLAVAAVLTFAQTLLLAWRWQSVYQFLTGAIIPSATIYFALGRGLLFGQLLPPVVGMDTIRVGLIAGHGGLMASMRSIVIDRVLSLVSLVIAVLVTLPLFAPWVHNELAVNSLLVASLGGLAAFFLAIGWHRAVAKMPLVGRALAQTAHDARQVLLSRAGALLMIVAVICQVLAAFIFVALALSLDQQISVTMCFSLMFPAMLVSSLPISLSGWGVREAVIASAFTLGGADPMTGATASILFGLTNLLAGVFGEICGFALRRREQRASRAAVPQI